MKRALVLLFLGILLIPSTSQATTQAWQNVTATIGGPNWHCGAKFYQPDGSSYWQACVIISGSSWQPAVIWHNEYVGLFMDQISATTQKASNGSAWVTAAHCNGPAVASPYNSTWSCFGSTVNQPNATVQAKGIGLQGVGVIQGPIFSPSGTRTGP